MASNKKLNFKHADFWDKQEIIFFLPLRECWGLKKIILKILTPGKLKDVVTSECLWKKKKEEENIDGEFQNVLIKRECEKGE